MLMATMLLSAGMVYADHAPPNQTATEVSISLQDETAIANIEAITPDAATIFTVDCAEVIYPVKNSANVTAQTPIAVDSGQGYKRCLSNVINKAINGTGWVLDKSGANRIRRLS